MPALMLCLKSDVLRLTSRRSQVAWLKLGLSLCKSHPMELKACVASAYLLT